MLALRRLSRLAVSLAAVLTALGCGASLRQVERGPRIERPQGFYRLPLTGDSRIAHEIRLKPGEVIDTSRLQRLDDEMLRRRLRDAEVILVGERHDSLAHHRLQWRVLDLLAERKPAIGLEMLPFTAQAGLDRYRRGEIDEATMLRLVGWRRNWGFDPALYRPLWLFARRELAPLLALNEPRRVVRQVARYGLDSLPLATRRRLPPIYLGSLQHRALFFLMVAGVHHHRKRSSSPHQQRGPRPSPHHGLRMRQRLVQFYQAQALWDETMAARVREQLRREPKRPVVVIAGNGHLVYGLGINMRLARRSDRLRIVTIVPVDVPPEGRIVSTTLGDIVVGIPQKAPKQGLTKQHPRRSK